MRVRARIGHGLLARAATAVLVAGVAWGAGSGCASPRPAPTAQTPPTPGRPTGRHVAAGATYVGSAACAPCHQAIYDRWRVTPMANVVRDPREHPDAILPDLTTNPLEKFTAADVALVYGSLWKQRYFTKQGDDYFVQPAQWDVVHKTWRKYFVERGKDWWADVYPPDNRARPTSALCDGCHSVGYDVATRKPVEWNVGCERCHGPGSAHAAAPAAVAVFDPGTADPADGTDSCIQCHSQGRPVSNPIGGRYYDWPVGYGVGKKLPDYWRLEEHRLGETTFTHYADGTGHKNRMQGNDYVQSLMYRRGVTCADCHDVHGTSNPAQLRRPGNALCLGCHTPGGSNGPLAATVEGHTHHAAGSAGSACVGCHMPKIETTLGDVSVRAHTFAVITPAMTDRYAMPNACNACHTDKDPRWAEAAMLKWSGVSPWRVR